MSNYVVVILSIEISFNLDILTILKQILERLEAKITYSSILMPLSIYIEKVII